MHRTEADNKIEVGGINLYTDGPPGTTIEADDRNTIQEELAYLIETAGLTLKTAATETNQQAYNAILALITANSPNSPKVDFESKDLIVKYVSATTVDANAKRLSLLNTSNVPAFIDDLDTTFDITTDLMAGTSEKASHWYQLWIDSGGTRLMVPDLTGTTDGTTASKLVDSGADFVTDLVQVGDEVYNTTDNTKTTVTAVDDLNTLSVAADIFVSGEDYVIHMLSPVGFGTAFKANIGAVYNDSGDDFVDFHQEDNRVSIVTTIIVAGAVAAIYTLASLVALVPVTAKVIVLSSIVCSENVGSVVQTLVASTITGVGSINTAVVATGATSVELTGSAKLGIIEPQSMYYARAVGDTTTISYSGWEY